MLEVDPSDGSSSFSTRFGAALNNPRDIVVIEDTDRDGDFIPDAWEVGQLGTIAQLPSDDGDNDLRDLFAEYAFGSRPDVADVVTSAVPLAPLSASAGATDARGPGAARRSGSTVSGRV